VADDDGRKRRAASGRIELITQPDVTVFDEAAEDRRRLRRCLAARDGKRDTEQGRWSFPQIPT
jgi:hypothetical protein